MSMFLIILEVLAVSTFVLFVGVLDSKYYENIRLKGLTIARDFVTVLLVLMCFLAGIEQGDHALPGCDFELISKWLQVIFHIFMIGVLIYSAVQFNKIHFTYIRQYLLTRACLYFSITFEALALMVIFAWMSGFPW